MFLSSSKSFWHFPFSLFFFKDFDDEILSSTLNSLSREYGEFTLPVEKPHHQQEMSSDNIIGNCFDASNPYSNSNSFDEVKSLFTPFLYVDRHFIENHVDFW